MERRATGIEEQTRFTLENIRDVLERAGSSLDRVVKVTVFITDMSQWPKMNEVYREYFPVDPPARSALGANGLALPELLVEMEAIAEVGWSQAKWLDRLRLIHGCQEDRQHSPSPPCSTLRYSWTARRRSRRRRG